MINLLFAGNNKVFNGMMITLLSIVKHTKCPINAYCFTMDLTEINENFIPISNEQAKYLEEILKQTNSDSKLTLFDLSKMFRKEMIDSVNIKSHFTPYSMLRLFADDVKEIPDKIIYLDTDTIINNDLSQLFDINIDNYELGCVKDAFNWASPSRWTTKGYFNAGVLLMNMKKIRETGMLKKARQLCHDKKMLYMDQDALNKSVTYKKMLPLIYNSKDKYYPEIVIHHFCNVRKNGNWFHRIKPWEVELVKSKMSVYDDILDNYVERKKTVNL
ncbi:MAG: hypothetical protein MR423_02070 [Firmicutes bacterium]|nr:hypothetical protein [Bacillota bacterium]MDY3659222.1 glycosyltransferase [Eubacteriales bacterium]